MMRRKVALLLLALALILFGVNHVVNFLNFKSPTTNIVPNDDPSLAMFSKHMYFQTIGQNFESANKSMILEYKRQSLYNSRGLHPTIVNSDKHALETVRKLGLTVTNDKTTTLQTLIVSYWKSGASFLGELLNELPQTFYHNEPLQELSAFQTINSTGLELRAIRLIRKLFNCEFGTVGSVGNRVNNSRILERMRHNVRIWRVCRDYLPFCSDPAVLTHICKTSKLHVMKTVRLRVGACGRILKQNPRLQIIHVVRDPRGMYNSLKDAEWCFDNCTDPKYFCKEIRRELVDAVNLQQGFHDRFVSLRYEDLESNPEAAMYKVLSFLGTKFEVSVKKYVQAQTKIKNEIYESRDGNKKDSNATSFNWLTELDKSEILDVQRKCRDIIDALQYPVFPECGYPGSSN